MPPPVNKKRKIAAGSDGTRHARRTTRSQRPGLSIEMIAKVASFANYGDEIMNICKAVGRKESAVVRYTCLRRNYRYLQHSAERNVRAEATNAKTGANVRAWMEINTDWKDDPVVGCVTREKSEGVTSTVTVMENGVRRTNCSAPAIFYNPAVAIDLGLVEVLKNLVENAGIDVNATMWNNYTHDEPYHLLVHNIFHENSACFDYLMTTQKIDMNSLVVSERLQTLKMFMMESDEISKERFQAMARLPTFGLNEPIDVAGRLIAPLIYMSLSASAADVPMHPDHMKKIQVLLDEGADPLREMGDNPSPMTLATTAASGRANAGDSSAVIAGWKEIVRMMKENIDEAEMN